MLFYYAIIFYDSKIYCRALNNGDNEAPYLFLRKKYFIDGAFINNIDRIYL